MTPYPADFKGDISWIETEVEDLKRKEDNLLAEVELVRASIQDRLAHIARLNDLHATIGVLPNKLLVIIFKSGPSDVIEHQRYVKSISLVSRYWRNLSLAIPSLWSFLYITPLIFKRSNQLEILGMFIERSCSHPLSIIIHGDLYSKPVNLSALSTQINLIIPHVSRWRTLSIHAGFWEEIPDMFAELHVPLLESFEVIVDIEQHDDDIDTGLAVFMGGTP